MEQSHSSAYWTWSRRASTVPTAPHTIPSTSQPCFQPTQAPIICTQSPLPRPLLLQRLPPLRPPLPRLLTQHPLWPPHLRVPHPPDPNILSAARKEIHPMLNTLLDLRPRIPALLLLQLLQRPAAVQRVDRRVIFRQVHELRAAQVGRDVLGETAGDESPCAVRARERVVRAAGAVEAPAR